MKHVARIGRMVLIAVSALAAGGLAAPRLEAAVRIAKGGRARQ